MIRSLIAGISGLKQFQGRMDVIGNNIANVNTHGFKSARSSFADAFSQTLQSSSAARDGNSGTAAMQIGSGVGTNAIKNVFTQGALSRTGVQTDLAVAGNGFFVVRDTLSNATYATRAGDFRLDENRYLITNTGHRVQGYSDAGLTTIGDIQIDKTGLPPTSDPQAELVSFGIAEDGKITVNLSDGTNFVRGQVLLQDVKDPQALVKEGDNLYSGIQTAGSLDWTDPSNPGFPGTGGLGEIQAGALELSNVELGSEFTDLITTQRAYQASARIITTSDEMLQELVNLKR